MKVVLSAIVAMVSVLGAAGPASADVFSPLIPYNTREYQVGDCHIKVGTVYDKYSHDGRFAVIGGVQVTCTTAHLMTIRVEEYRDGAYLPSVTRQISYSSPSRGTGTSNILETGRACGSGSWATRFVLTVYGRAWDGWSWANTVTALGYSSTVC